MTAKDNEGNKAKITDTTKVTIYCQIYKRVYVKSVAAVCGLQPDG